MIENKCCTFFIAICASIVAFSLGLPTGENETLDKLAEDKSETFLYFAYGRNMLAEKMHITSPTAVERGIGKLENYRLDFNLFSKSWQGAVATIIPQPGSEVWGVIWEISNLPKLDKQEQEHYKSKEYFTTNVTITTPTGEKLNCITLLMNQVPDKYVKLSDLPSDRQPSSAYLNTIIRGAESHNIPENYIKFLKSISHNE